MENFNMDWIFDDIRELLPILSGVIILWFFFFFVFNFFFLKRAVK